MKKARFTIFLLPLLFIGLFTVYKDTFYSFLAMISGFFSILIIIPSLFSKRTIFKNSKTKRNNNEKDIEFAKNITDIVEKQVKKHAYLPLAAALFLFFLLIFSYIAVYRLNVIPNSQNLILEYYRALFFFFKPFLAYPFFAVLVISYILSIYIPKRRSNYKVNFKPKQYPFYFALVAGTLLAAFIISITSTYLFGLIEINFIATRINLYPSSAGVTVGKDAIIKKLQNSDGNLSVIGSDSNIKNLVLSQLIVRNEGQKSYYIQRVIKNIPTYLTLQISLPKQSLVMVGNTLIVSELNKNDIQSISPTIAKIFLKHYFKSRYLKDSTPNITVMGRQEYLTFREKQIDNEVAKLNDVIQKIKDYMSSLYGSISTDKQKISVNQNGLDSSISERDSAYDYCMKAGYYFYGYFYHTFTQAYCNSSRSNWDNVIASFQKNISDWQQQLQYDQKELSDSIIMRDYIVSIREVVDSQRDVTPQELGIFEPEDNIKLALDSTSPKAINNYIETLSHEYLHYASYISDKKQLDHFFEEGLTEYYARKIVKDNLRTDVNLGYPLISKLIEQMMTKIPEKELQNIYFTKDQNELTGLLDNAYGKNFYEDTKYYFTAISYSPADKALKMANNIMYRIGGKELSEKDLYSSSLSNQ